MIRYGASTLILLLSSCALEVNSANNFENIDRNNHVLVNTNVTRPVRSTCEQYLSSPNNMCGNQTIISSTNQTGCIDNLSSIGNSVYAGQYSKCCCASRCPYNTTDDTTASATNDVELVWYAGSETYTNLWVNWTYPSSGNILAGYQLWVGMSGNSNWQRCMCLAPNTTFYSVKVKLTASYYIHVKLISLPGQRCADDERSVPVITKKIPEYCWDLEEASFEKCGPMFPSAPQNLTVTSVPVNESSIILWIRWKLPLHYNPDVIAYKIRISNDAYYIDGTMLDYNITKPATGNYSINVSASSGYVHVFGTARYKYCHGAFIHSQYSTYCWSPYASTHLSPVPITAISSSHTPAADTKTEALITTSSLVAMSTLLVTPSNGVATGPAVQHHKTEALITTSSLVTTSVTPSNGVAAGPAEQHHNVGVISVLSVLALVFIILLLVMLGLWLRIRSKYRREYYMVTQEVPHVPIERGVFIVAHNDSREIRNLCHQLVKYSIQPIYYKYVENDQSNSPAELGTVRWAERNFLHSNMVLFVCDQGFYNVWQDIRQNNSNSNDPYHQIILTCREMFNTRLDLGYSRFVAIVSTRSDYRHIPDRLRNAKHLTLSGGIEHIVRYILEIPTHLPPRVN